MLKAKQLYAPPYIISHDYEKWYYYFGGRASSMFLSLGILPLGYALTILSNNIYIHKRFSFPFYHQPDVEKGKKLDILQHIYYSIRICKPHLHLYLFQFTQFIFALFINSIFYILQLTTNFFNFTENYRGVNCCTDIFDILLSLIPACC